MMSRLLLLTWLARRNPIHLQRMSKPYTTGIPSKYIHNTIFTRTTQKLLYASSNYVTMSGHLFEQTRKLNYKNVQNNNVAIERDKQTMKQQTVRELLDCYIHSRDSEFKLNPIRVLEDIARSTEKSAKQSLFLQNEPALQISYITLLKDISESVELSNDTKQDIVSVLHSLGMISKRQKLFINKSEIDIYPDERSKTNETLLPEDVTMLYERIQNILLRQDFSGYQEKDIVTVLVSFVESNQGNAELFDRLKNVILNQNATDFTSKEIGQIVHSYGKLKTRADSNGIFKSMMDEILHRGFVSFMNSEIPVLLVAFARAKQGKSDFYKTIKKDILSRDIQAFTSPELCQILWSFSKVQEKYSFNLSDLLNRFESEFLQRGVKRLDDRGLAVLLWSLVEMNYFSKKLFTLLRNVILKRKVRKLDAGDISTFLRCFAKVKAKINSHHFFAMVDKELVHRGFSVFNDSQLATITWAFAKTGHGCNALLILLKREMFTRNIKDFSGVDLSQITWGLAKLREQIHIKDLLEYLGNEIAANYNVSKLSLRQLALLAWSFAVTDVVHKELFEDLQAEISKRGLIECSNSVLCQILYSFAVAKGVVRLGNVIKSVERKILVNHLGSFDNRQLALLVWSLAEILIYAESTKIFEILENEVTSRPLREYMPADICRILWGLSKVNSEINTAVVFNSLKKDLIQRGLGEYSIAQITMATVALTKANEWNEETYSLFHAEIMSRNSRHFDSVHLCSLARSFSSINFETTALFSWLGEEVISRGIWAFEAEDLLMILQLLVEQNVKQLRVFETIKKQLIDSGVKRYSKTDIDRLCLLLQAAGIDTDDLECEYTQWN